MNFTITPESVSEHLQVLHVAGDITLDTAGILRDKLEQLTAPGTDLVLDLANVSYVDSTGLGVIVSSYINAQKTGGKIVLAGLTKRLRDLLAITKLSSIFSIYETVEEAKTSLKSN